MTPDITKEELKGTGLEGEDLVNYVAKRKGITRLYPQGEFLSGDTSEQEPIDIERMRIHWPNYPYPESKEECKFCNNVINNAYVDQVLHGFKLVIKDKDTHEIKTTIIGPTVEGCDHCGRKLSISDKGIEFLE